MGVTATTTDVFVIGDRKAIVGTLAFDSSYPTGGEALTKATLGTDINLDFVSIPPNSGYVFQYDYTNSKVLAYQGDNDNAADAPLVEVADTTSLAALTAVKFFAIGKSTAAGKDA